MTIHQLPYDRWLEEGVEEAKRSVVRRALAYAAEFGLPETHHFCLSFVTAAAGVELAPELRARYPDEMTIVLQHQFWDPAIQDDIFSVTLKFGGRPSRIVIPLAAITAFGDPSVNFGLGLKPSGSDAGEAPIDGDEDADGTGPDRPSESGSAQVITLDTFRKK